MEESYRRDEGLQGDKTRVVSFRASDSDRGVRARDEGIHGCNSERDMEVSGAEQEACPYGCSYKSSDIWLIKAHLTKCPNFDGKSSSEEGGSNLPNLFAKHMVKSHIREVESMVDDNLNILCKARFWSLPSSSQALYAALPTKAVPARYNYNFNECGLTVNNVKVVIKLHDRINTSLTLNMFTNAALAKHETNRSWKPGRDPTSMLVEEEFAELKQVQEAMEALNNFRLIFNQIWPVDFSVEILWNVVWKQMLTTAYKPQVADIAELFAYWLQDRAQAAMECRPPTTFFHLQSYMNNLCQRRAPTTSSGNNSSGVFFGEPKGGKEALPFKRYKIAKKGSKWQNSSGYTRDLKPKIMRQIEDITCRKFNSAAGCFHQVEAGGACISRFGRWMHLCNFLDNSTGKLCLKPHSVTQHK